MTLFREAVTHKHYVRYKAKNAMHIACKRIWVGKKEWENMLIECRSCVGQEGN